MMLDCCTCTSKDLRLLILNLCTYAAHRLMRCNSHGVQVLYHVAMDFKFLRA